MIDEKLLYFNTFELPPASLVAYTSCAADSQTVLALSNNSVCFCEPPGSLDAKPIAQSANGSAKFASLIT